MRPRLDYDNYYHVITVTVLEGWWDPMGEVAVILGVLAAEVQGILFSLWLSFRIIGSTGETGAVIFCR